jgi:hypothetical protein
VACRTNCATQDHETFGACARAANIKINAVMVSPQRPMFDQTKKELSAYDAARRNGIQPEGTTINKVKAAENASRALGRPYNADVDPPTNMIVNKKVARFVASGAA